MGASDKGGANPRARVEFPDMFIGQIDEFIADADLRDFLLWSAIGPEIEKNYREYLLSPLPDGVIGTADGYVGVPSLWLWFRHGLSTQGEPFAVFNRAVLQPPPSEAEDDSG